MIRKVLVFCIVLLCSRFSHSGDARVVEIKDGNSNIVIGDIYLNIRDKKHHKGKTDSNGSLLLDEGCFNADTVIAEPDNPFYHAGKNRCGKEKGNIVVTVIEMSFYSALKNNAATLEAEGEFAKAALVYSEIASREVDLEESQAAREKSIINYVKAVGLDPKRSAVVYYDPQQEMKVIGPQLHEFLMVERKRRNLSPDGGLGYDLLSAEARADVGEFMVDRH